MPINLNALKILNGNQEAVKNDYEAILKRLEDKKHPKIVEFLNLVLAWHTDRVKSQWLWEMFGLAFNCDNPLDFFRSLNSFIGNCLLDDSYFLVEWREADLSWSAYLTDDQAPVRDMEYDEYGRVKTILVSSESPRSRPRVKWINDGNLCNRDPQVLLDAMVVMEAREIEKMREYEELTGESYC